MPDGTDEAANVGTYAFGRGEAVFGAIGVTEYSAGAQPVSGDPFGGYIRAAIYYGF